MLTDCTKWWTKRRENEVIVWLCDICTALSVAIVEAITQFVYWVYWEHECLAKILLNVCYIKYIDKLKYWLVDGVNCFTAYHHFESYLKPKHFWM